MNQMVKNNKKNSSNSLVFGRRPQTITLDYVACDIIEFIGHGGSLEIAELAFYLAQIFKDNLPL